MTMAAWSPVPRLTIGNPGLQVFRSLSDAGEPMLGAIAIPDLIPTGGPLFHGRVRIWADYDGGTTTSATASCGFSCSARIDWKNAVPVVAGGERQTTRFYGSQISGGDDIYDHTQWGVSNRYGAQIAVNNGGTIPASDVQYDLTFNLLDITYSIGSLAGNAELDGLYVFLIPRSAL